MSTAIFYIKSDHGERPHEKLFDILFPHRSSYFQEPKHQSHPKLPENLCGNLLIKIAAEIADPLRENRYCSIDPTQFIRALRDDTNGELWLTREMMLAIITFYVGYIYSGDIYDAKNKIQKRITNHIKRGNLEFQGNYFPNVELSEATGNPDLLKSLKVLFSSIYINTQKEEGFKKVNGNDRSEIDKFNVHISALSELYHEPEIKSSLSLHKQNETWYLGFISLDPETEDKEPSDEDSNQDKSTFSEIQNHIDVEVFMGTREEVDNDPSEDVKNGVHETDREYEKNSAFISYFSRIEKEFSTIALKIVNYSLPIEKIVPASLKQENEAKRKRLTIILGEISEEENRTHFCNIERRSELIQKRVQIEEELETEYSLFELVKKYESVFIHAPAGTGKSTALRWLAYKTAVDYQSFFPVYVELQYYKKRGDLMILIREAIGSVSLPEPDQMQVLLLVDGFDECVGAPRNLLKELNDFDREYRPKIIFSGRYIPDFSRINIDFAICSLEPLGTKGVSALCRHSLGDEIGIPLSLSLLESELIYELTNPLYLVIVLAFVKSKKEDLNFYKIISQIRNRGALFEHVIIEKYLLNYEATRTNIRKDEWERLKALQITFLSELAYEMTFNFGNVEAFEENDVKKLIKKRPSYENVDIVSWLSDYCNHGFLQYKNHTYTFQKKELRLFLCSRHLITIIRNRKDWRKLRKKLKKSDNQQDDTWRTIHLYLIGLIRPSVILSGRTIKKTYGGKFIISERRLWELFRILEFLMNGVELKEYDPIYVQDRLMSWDDDYDYVISNQSFLSFVAEKFYYPYMVFIYTLNWLVPYKRDRRIEIYNHLFLLSSGYNGENIGLAIHYCMRLIIDDPYLSEIRGIKKVKHNFKPGIYKAEMPPKIRFRL